MPSNNNGSGRDVHRRLVVFCRRIWNEGRGGSGGSSATGCCKSDIGATLRDRLKLYRVHRTACQTGCTRIFLIVLNFAFLLSGCSLVVFGVWLHVDRDSTLYADLLQAVPPTGPLVISGQLSSTLIAVGAGVSIISFLGCCGTCADSACFICLYILLLLIILLTELVVGVSTVAYADQISERLQFGLQQQIRNEYNKTGRSSRNGSVPNPADHVTATWDAMQIKLSCCGATGPLDYKHSAWYNRSRYVDFVWVPASCCFDQSSSRSPGTSGVLSGSQPGPVHIFHDYLRHHNRHGSGSQQQAVQKPLYPTEQPPLSNRQQHHQHGGSSTALPPSYDHIGDLAGNNDCQLEAILVDQYGGHAVSTKSTHLKTQGCQRSIVSWLSSNLTTIACLVCIAFVIQVLNVFFACMLMMRLRQRHFEGSQWSDDSDVE